MPASEPIETHSTNLSDPAAKQPLQSIHSLDLQENGAEHRRLEILLDIHQAILSTQNLRSTVHLALNHLKTIVPDYRASSVLLLDSSVNEAEVLAFNLNGRETDWPGEPRLSFSDLAVDLEALAQGTAFFVQDLGDIRELAPLQQSMLANGIRAYLTIPLRVRAELTGLLNLASGTPGSFTPETLRAATEIGDTLAVAIQQARLLEAEQQRRQEAEVMRDVMAALASSVNLNQALEIILRNLGNMVPFDRAALYMQNENAQFQMPPDSTEEQLPKIFPVDDPIIANLSVLRRPLVIADIQQDQRFAGWPEQELVRGWMGVPLFAGDEMIGILSLGDLEAGAYDANDANLVQLFTSQVADVLFRARLQESSNRRAEELELLTAFSFAIRHAEGRENILAALMDQTTQVFGATQGTFLLLEQDASALMVSFSQNPDLVGLWHAHGSDPLWKVIRTGKPEFVGDIQAFLESYQQPIYTLLFAGMQSAALLPLSTPENTFGVLCFTFQGRQEFSQEDQRLFNVISEIAGTALRRAVVLESLEKRVSTRTRHLSTLYEISAVAGEPAEIEDLLERMLIITLGVMGSPVGAIHLIDDRQKVINLSAQVSIPPEIMPGFASLAVQSSFWRNLVFSSEPVIIPNLKEDLRAPEELKGSPFPAYLVAPIRSKGHCLGLLSLLNESILDFTIEDITLFTTIAEQIGSAVERARLQRQAERAAVAEERQRLARELHDSISQLLYSLVLYAGAGRKILHQGNQEQAAEYLRRIDQTSQQALKEMRLMVYELRPSVFREEGLVGALNRRLQAVEQRTGMNAQLVVEGQIAFDEAVELALYRIAEEALNNTLKHAEASQVILRIAADQEHVDLEINDNGKGFDLQAGKTAGGLGLTGMQERVDHFGGRLEITTTPGQGTRVHVHLEIKDD